MEIIKNRKFSSIIILLSTAILFSSPIIALAQTSSTQNGLLILDTKVNLLNDINGRILNTVYWTLGILAAIFLGIISVNLYFNISANKREIQKIKEEILGTSKNLIKTAEAEITEKVSTANRKENDRIKEEILGTSKNLIKTAEAEITEKVSTANRKDLDKEIENVLNIIKNETLIYQTKITEQVNTIEKSVLSINSGIKNMSGKLEEAEVDIKELDAFMYSQKGKMGGIINQIELLEYDIKNRSWYLKYRLADLKEEIKRYDLTKELDKKLRELLSSIKDKKEFTSEIEEIEKSITLRPEKDKPIP